MSLLRAIVKGRVQGVGFRYFVYDLALQYSLRGFVRNLWNGDVEVEAEGDNELLLEFLERLRKGPRFGHVDNVEVHWEKEKGYKDFRITF